MSILFLNHSKQQCGVYQYGKRLFEILQKTGNYTYVEIETVQEYQMAILKYTPTALVYNYHQSTMPWLNRDTIQKEVMNIGIPHESPEHLFDIVCDIDPTANESVTRFSLPRPIYENVDALLENYTPSPSIQAFIDYSEGVPVFGSFGFGFLNKGFELRHHGCEGFALFLGEDLFGFRGCWGRCRLCGRGIGWAGP
jgi:hypothetical protein